MKAVDLAFHSYDKCNIQRKTIDGKICKFAVRNENLAAVSMRAAINKCDATTRFVKYMSHYILCKDNSFASLNNHIMYRVELKQNLPPDNVQEVQVVQGFNIHVSYFVLFPHNMVYRNYLHEL